MSKTIQFNGTITIPDDLLPQDTVNVFKLETNTHDNGCCRGYSPTPPPKQDLGKYAGKFVFVERVRTPADTSQTYSTYNNGEYFCVLSSQNTLSSYAEDGFVKSFIEEQQQFIDDYKTGRGTKGVDRDGVFRGGIYSKPN